jgi:CDGSH-type Zn-finger protein
MPKPRCGFCDGHHIPVDFDAASVAASRGVAIH